MQKLICDFWQYLGFTIEFIEVNLHSKLTNRKQLECIERNYRLLLWRLQKAQGLHQEVRVLQIAGDTRYSIEKVRVRKVEKGKDKNPNKTHWHIEPLLVLKQERLKSGPHV